MLKFAETFFLIRGERVNETAELLYRNKMQRKDIIKQGPAGQRGYPGVQGDGAHPGSRRKAGARDGQEKDTILSKRRERSSSSRI